MYNKREFRFDILLKKLENMKTVVLIFCLYLLVAGEQTEKKVVQDNVLNEAKEVGRLFQG
jgi:hypothetical protein